MDIDKGSSLQEKEKRSRAWKCDDVQWNYFNPNNTTFRNYVYSCTRLDFSRICPSASDNNLSPCRLPSRLRYSFAQQRKTIWWGWGRMTSESRKGRSNWLPSERFPSSASCVYTEQQKNGNLNAEEAEAGITICTHTTEVAGLKKIDKRGKFRTKNLIICRLFLSGLISVKRERFLIMRRWRRKLRNNDPKRG